MMPAPGSDFAGYTILAECGKGAYGSVFLAKDAIGRRVALKYMLSTAAGSYELKGLRNYMSLAPLPPALLQIFHCGMDGDCLFYAMEAADNAAESPDEYLPDTLANRLAHARRISATEALAMGRQLLDSLEFLHRASIIHRDIKPENIVYVNGMPKLADPGLTRALSQSISIAGTPGYLAPELLNGAKNSPATDLYALGKVLYRAVTGNPPDLYPEQPADVPVAELYQLCRPLMRLCNSDPKLRCQSCAEARQILPTAIRPHGPLLNFRDKLFIHKEFRKTVFGYAWQGLTLLALLCAAFAATRFHYAAARQLGKSAQHAEQLACERNCQKLLRQLGQMEENAAALKRQLESHGEDGILTELDKIRQFLTNGDIAAAAKALHAYREMLAALALSHLPAPATDFFACGRAWGFLASPLGGFLPPEQRAELAARLKRESAALTVPGAPQLGETYRDFHLEGFQLTFIPPGTFHSPTTGTTQHVPYPFWMATDELSSDLFRHVAKQPIRRTPATTAMEFIAWNDQLLFCRSCTEFLADILPLPPGYAVRPPTEAEWEFVALNGWASRPPMPRETTADNRHNSIENEEVNSFGIKHLDDQLAEVAIPYPELAPDYAGAAIARGADYRSLQTGVTERFQYLRDQMHRWGVGCRPVLAPTSDDFFQTEWYRGPEIRQTTLDGLVFAGFTTIQANLTWNAAVQLAADLGASLPDTADLPRLPILYKRLGLVDDYPCHLAIHYQDEAWRDLATGHSVAWPAAHYHEPPAAGTRTALGASALGIDAYAEDMAAPVLLLKWKSKEDFDRRARTFLKNAALDAFEFNGKRLAVCRAPLTPYAVRSFANFIGLSQPTLDDAPDALQALLGHFPGESACALGPIRFYHHWEQPDGTTLQLPQSPPEYPILTYHSNSLLVLAARNGALVQAGSIDSFLVETPQSPPGN